MTGSDISGWGEAHQRIIEAVHFMCDGKTGLEHADAVIDIVKLVRQTAMGNEPALSRRSWAIRMNTFGRCGGDILRGALSRR